MRCGACLSTEFDTDLGECAELAHRVPFVNISATDNDSYAEKGMEMITQIMTNKWPVVDKQKIEGILSWNSISKKLEQVYLNKM